MANLTPVERQLAEARFNKSHELIDEFGDLECYLAYLENKDSVRTAPKAFDRYESPKEVY